MRHQLLHIDPFIESQIGVKNYLAQKNKEDDTRYKTMLTITKNAFWGELTPRQRECVYLYDCRQKKLTEISKLLRINPSTVCRHIQKAHKRLNIVLQYYYPVDTETSHTFKHLSHFIK